MILEGAMVALIDDILRNSQLPPRRVRRPVLYQLGVSLAAGVASWARRIREAEDLAKLDDRELRDIGLTRAEARMVLDKPFWRA
jgi:uncharacterized protein YjiS (DUF1127 family)